MYRKAHGSGLYLREEDEGIKGRCVYMHGLPFLPDSGPFLRKRKPCECRKLPEGERKYYGRFNQGVVTVNLVDIGLSARKDMNRFWEIFDERMELCHRAMRCRHERLKGTLSDAAPILWQYGAPCPLKER